MSVRVRIHSVVSRDAIQNQLAAWSTITCRLNTFGHVVCWATLLAMLFAGCGRKQDSRTAAARVNPAEPDSLSITNQAIQAPHAVSQPTGTSVQEPSILSWETVDGLPEQLSIFDHVFWEPDDTSTFRKLLRDENLVQRKNVLEIGTGSGLISLCCLQSGAASVVATDINPWAVKNATYNASVFQFEQRMSVRLVSQKRPDAWAVIGDNERFDVIFSNPPWELGTTTRVEDFAFYDPGFKLMTSFLDGLPNHLNPGGRTFLAYGCVEAIRKLQQESKARNFECLKLDDRNLDELPNLFLPGMLLEIKTNGSQ